MLLGKDGPIPGENFTSDTKSYPWHQPPEFSDVSSALDKMAIKLTTPKVARGIMAFADAGFPLTRITQMIIMEGIAQGKWTVDMGLLLAGPFCKIIEIMCDSHDIDYKLGIEEEDSFNTGTFFKGSIELEKSAKSSNLYEIVKQELPAIENAAEETSSGSTEGSATASTEAPEEDLGMQGFTQMTSSTPAPEEKEE